MAAIFETENESELKKKIAKGKVIVLFYASWCGDCRAFLPCFDKNSPSCKAPVLKARIDEDENPIWDSFEIEYVPTAVLFNNGKEVARKVCGNGKTISEKDLLELFSLAGKN